MNAYLDFLTSTILAPKSNIPDEALPTDPLTLKQQAKRVICDPAAFTRQAQKRIALVDCFPDTARFPIAIEVHHGREAQEQVWKQGLWLVGPGLLCHSELAQAVRGISQPPSLIHDQ